MTKKKGYENNFFYIEFGVDLEKRRIVLDEDIDEYSVGWALRGMQLMEDNSNEPIDFYISSYGGSVYDGFAMFDAMKRSKCLIRTHAMGKTMSISFIIYLAGQERYSSNYATFLNHSISSASWGKLHEMKTEVKECERLENIALDILCKETIKERGWWKRQSKYEDRYYDMGKAIELGIVTHEYE